MDFAEEVCALDQLGAPAEGPLVAYSYAGERPASSGSVALRRSTRAVEKRGSGRRWPKRNACAHSGLRQSVEQDNKLEMQGDKHDSTHQESRHLR